MAIRQMYALEWREYAAAQEWTTGTPKERAALKAFEERTRLAWEALLHQAMRGKMLLGFGVLHVRRLALAALVKPCTYCGNVFGVYSLGVAWDEPIRRVDSVGTKLGNVAVCCADCAVGKGSLSGGEWRDLLAALRAADPVAAAEARRAIVAGRLAAHERRASAKVLPDAAGAAGNARVRGRSSDSPQK